MEKILIFILGLIIGIILSVVALLWDALKSKSPKVWIDDDYKIHLIKKKWKL